MHGATLFANPKRQGMRKGLVSPICTCAYLWRNFTASTFYWHMSDNAWCNHNTGVLFPHTSSDAEDLDHCLLYALQRLDSSEVRHKPTCKQRFEIESVYRGDNMFVWYLPEIINLLPEASSRYTIVCQCRLCPCNAEQSNTVFAPNTSSAQA